MPSDCAQLADAVEAALAEARDRAEIYAEICTEIFAEIHAARFTRSDCALIALIAI